MLSDTTNPPLFWDGSPDWGPGMSAVFRWTTAISTAIDGTEQRFRLRTTPRINVVQRHTWLRSEWARRQADLEAVARSKVVVPLWGLWWKPKSTALIHDSVNPSIEFEAAELAWTPFRVPGYIYIRESGLQSVFLKIVGFADDVGNDTMEPHTVLRLETFSGTHIADWPAVAVPNYTTAAMVHPCVEGVLADGRIAVSHEHLAVVGETFALEGL
jgi:hypothetical protein